MTTKQPTFAFSDPVEVRIETALGRVYQLVAWVTGNGTINHTLTVRGHGTPESLSNLQSRASFPGKAVQGWQAEVIAFAEAGLGKVVEVR